MAQTKVIDFDGKEMAPKKNCTWRGRERYHYATPLTDKDRIDIAQDMADSLAEIDKLEFEKKIALDEFKQKIDAERSNATSCGKYLRNGKFDPEPRDCDVYQDWDTCELVWITHDEERIEVYRRKMTAEERQPTLFDEAPDAPKPEDK